MAEENTTPPAVDPAKAPPAADWFAGFEPEYRGFLETKGWNKLDPAAAALEAVKSYREVEKFRGIPAEQMFRFPKDAADADGWKALHEKLGVPAEAKGYDFNGVKFADGSVLSDGFADRMRAAALDGKLTPAAANRMTAEFVKYLDDAEAQATKAATEAREEEGRKLDANWGAHKETNMDLAKRFCQREGIAPEAVEALQNVIGYAGTMEMFRKLAVASGEARFIQGQGGDQTRVMSADQAQSRKLDLMRDAGWRAKWELGDVDARKEMADLDRLIVEARFAAMGPRR